MKITPEFVAAYEASTPEKRAEIDALRAQVEALESAIANDTARFSTLFVGTPDLSTGGIWELVPAPHKPKFGRGGRRNRKIRRSKGRNKQV